jgi:hypothetical protein
LNIGALSVIGCGRLLIRIDTPLLLERFQSVAYVADVKRKALRNRQTLMQSKKSSRFTTTIIHALVVHILRTKGEILPLKFLIILLCLVVLNYQAMMMPPTSRMALANADLQFLRIHSHHWFAHGGNLNSRAIT